MEAWERVRDTMLASGFSATSGRAYDTYKGNVSIGKVQVELEVEVPDYDFLIRPAVRVLNQGDLPKRLTAHIVENGTLCYADPDTLILDRYAPDRSVMAVVEQAKKTLSVLLHGNPTAEYMAEFASYWSATRYHLIDDPRELEMMVLGICDFGHGPQCFVGGAGRERLETWAKTAGGSFQETTKLPVVQAISEIKPPPLNVVALKGVVDWLEPQVRTIRPLMDLTISKGNPTPALMVAAPNAIIGFRAVEKPLISQAKGRGFRKQALPGLWKREAASVELYRFQCQLATAREMTERNIGSAAPLSGRRIALLGCGTIGGYLARSLVQLGAGLGASLLLVDGDVLQPENLGRHLLGVADMGRSKARAMCDALKRDFPDCDVSYVEGRAQKSFDRLRAYDLVIDATGEEAFSNALNAHALSEASLEHGFPSILYASIFGNGAAVQTYLATLGEGLACYRCLKPRIEEGWRHSPVKPDATVAELTIRPCAHGSFAPFSVSASLAAASLASQHAADFFSKGYSGDLRTLVVDPEHGISLPRKSVTRSKLCPACSTGD